MSIDYYLSKMEHDDEYISDSNSESSFSDISLNSEDTLSDNDADTCARPIKMFQFQMWNWILHVGLKLFRVWMYLHYNDQLDIASQKISVTLRILLITSNSFLLKS